MNEDVYGNWYNPFYDSDLDSQDYEWPDEDVWYKEYLPNVEWVRIWAVSCKCTKFIKVDDEVQAKNNEFIVSFCSKCGLNNGIFSMVPIKDREDLKKYLGYNISPRDEEILCKMKYL